MIQASLRDTRFIMCPVPALKGRPKVTRRYAAKDPALSAGLITLRASRVNVAQRTDFFMQEIFGHDGLIAKAHPEYEHRPGQIQMAEAVVRAFEQRRHLIVEAGTGTGKTLAYLVPAIAAACGNDAREGIAP